jgi:DNA-binding GntR family transcriptional regulator
VAARLRSAIVTGHFALGTRMVERDLTTRLQVSRTPIREALRRLEHEELIVGFPHRGDYVEKPSYSEARQAYEARRVIEGACCGLAARRASDVDVAAMRHALRKAQTVLDSGDRVSLLDCNRELHHLMVKAARNAFLEKEWAAMWAFADLLRGRWWGRTHRPETGHYEHEALVEAIARHDSSLAQRLGAAHVDRAWTNVSTRFEQHETRAAAHREGVTF